MPAKNAIKVYVEDGYYHIYNRGVEKRVIFQDEQDYKVFLRYLKEYLSQPLDKSKIEKVFFTLQGQTFKGIERAPKNYFGKIDLIAYCLMPNHFHFILKQSDDINSIKEFMRSIATRYSMYFNKKYDREGSLFQGRYRGILITDEPYLLHLSRYIHLNPGEYTENLTSAYSSYADYLGLRYTLWLKPDVILQQFNNRVGIEFKKINSYKDFVEKYKQEDKLILGNLSID